MQRDTLLTIEEIKGLGTVPMNFIVAKERSGTTLLQLMLNAHPNIIAPPESRFIILLYFRYRKTIKWTEEVITKFCNDIFAEGLFRNFWGLDKEVLESTLLAAKDILTYPIICKIIFRLSSPAKKEVTIFFDKNPVYYYFLPELNKIFPEAKYIHLVRDYRANIVSHQRVFTVKNANDITYRWMKVNMLIEAVKRHSPQKFYTLNYESLVGNPVETMEKVCGFLNISFNKNMAENHQSGMFSGFNENTKDGFRKVHENVFHPINPALIDEWKEKITTTDLNKVETIAGKYAETMYGYKLLNPKKLKKNTSGSNLFMALKYRGIKLLYRTALANIWLYRLIKKNIWRHF